MQSIKGPLILLILGRRLTEGVDEATDEIVLLLVLLTGARVFIELAVDELLGPNNFPIVGMLLVLESDLGRPSCCFFEMTLLIVAYFS